MNRLSALVIALMLLLLAGNAESSDLVRMNKDRYKKQVRKGKRVKAKKAKGMKMKKYRSFRLTLRKGR